MNDIDWNNLPFTLVEFIQLHGETPVIAVGQENAALKALAAKASVDAEWMPLYHKIEESVYVPLPQIDWDALPATFTEFTEKYDFTYFPPEDDETKFLDFARNIEEHYHFPGVLDWMKAQIKEHKRDDDDDSSSYDQESPVNFNSLLSRSNIENPTPSLFQRLDKHFNEYTAMSSRTKHLLRYIELQQDVCGCEDPLIQQHFAFNMDMIVNASQGEQNH
jgi:hypothetical protein